MKRLFISFIFFIGSLVLVQAQQSENQAQQSEQVSVQTQQDSTVLDSTRIKCMAESKHLISLDLLQFVVGTGNINYEFRFAPRFSVKVGVGRIVGYRILTNGQQIVNGKGNSISFGDLKTGVHYAMIEPRYYLPKSVVNCWMNTGFALSYKFWDYQHKEAIYSDEPSTDDVIKDANDKTIDETVYKNKNKKHHLVGLSFFGKHPIVRGLTFEYQLGVASGLLDKKFYISPNLAFSMGWSF